MKFLVKTSDFLKAIHAVEGVITVREIKSVLSNIKIETGDNIVFLSATDLEISIKTSVEAKIIEPGKSSIPAKQLNNTLKTINFSETSSEIIIYKKIFHYFYFTNIILFVSLKFPASIE